MTQTLELEHTPYQECGWQQHALQTSVVHEFAKHGHMLGLSVSHECSGPKTYVCEIIGPLVEAPCALDMWVMFFLPMHRRTS